MKIGCVVAVFCLFLFQVDGLKVLGVVPFGSSSHFAIGSSILKTLAKADHEVTVISPYLQKKPLKNYRDVDASSVLDLFEKGEKSSEFNTLHQVSLIQIQTKFQTLSCSVS